MEYELLNIIWFVLIAVLYIGFFILEGFDFGVGILMPFLGKTDVERRAIINTIGPHWDANEVWLITAGGATFAAFPHWYATLFSGFYFPLFLILIALIVRGVAFEFRSKDDNLLWRKTWDWAIFVGSLLPGLLLGVAFANLVRGVPIDENMIYTGGFFNLLNPFALLAGISMLLSIIHHGAIYLSLKIESPVKERALTVAKRLWVWNIAAIVLLIVGIYLETDFLDKGINPGLIPVIAVIAILLAGFFLRRGQERIALAMTSLGIAASIATTFLILYPRVMISSSNPDWSLDIANASSSPYTLQMMLIVALILLPILLTYQIWSYRTFRHRVPIQADELEY